ncbi:MAG: hypothetical protein AB8D78_10480 [Akkermansiaceae bacterium]
MKRILLSLGAISLLNSCNTFIGVGRDTKIAGETIEKVAEKAAPGTSDYEDTSEATNDPVYSSDDSPNLDYNPDPAGVLPVY